MTDSPRPRPVVLCILDGWGEREETDFNAIAAANTPVWDRLRATCPRARLDASGGEVGLPDGQMGNSEVGHTNIGAGRVVRQDLPRIDAAAADGSLARAPALAAFIEALKSSGGTAHLMGLISPGGVHSHQDQIAGLANILADAGIPVAVHAFLDGRDTPPSSGRGYMEDFLAAAPRATAATVTGRYYAMDRDKRCKRTAKAYHAIVCGEGERAGDAAAAVEQAYARGETDEFVAPTVIEGGPPLRDGDAVIFFNFRADRARELTNAITDVQPEHFVGELERSRVVRPAAFVTFTEYDADYGLPIAFPSAPPRRTLGELVAEAGLSQLRVAETEKYAHVTF
ncbi:MAG: phosphoglycerate mutase (2,3-diphosphoglycerate-independent), partial [Alphaproteobacteria bacterium]|nr:phosphoglycerate mutase (2,3-diphosphoglycerate-independent) [Alphaproteobacteria bacterium]